MPRSIVALILAGLTFGTLSGSATPAPAAADEPVVWLCRPGLADNPCTLPLTSTAIVDAKLTKVTTAPIPTASRFDCFYVYPTVSAQKTSNANLRVEDAERGIASSEASRFSEACNVWAPVYRQITEATQEAGRYDTPAYGDVAYDCVRAAWRAYLANSEQGRPIVFIGHSQGTQMLSRLLRNEIEPNPALRKRVLLAILVGGNVAVAASADGKGSFTSIPACGYKGQTGCLIGYSLFSQPPPPDSRFGIPGQGSSLQGKQFARTGVRIVCTNPAALSGGSAPLDAYLRTVPGAYGMAPKNTAPPGVTTPWVEYPGLFTAQCRHQGNATWLNVTRNGPAGGYPQLFIELPKFGLHNYDLQLPLGDLIADVKAAEASYRAIAP